MLLLNYPHEQKSFVIKVVNKKVAINKIYRSESTLHFHTGNSNLKIIIKILHNRKY